jgi:hypothetical protein
MPTEKWVPKPIPRDVVEWTGTYADLPAKWRRLGALEPLDDGALLITTNHGPARAERGDYIVRDLAGTFYPMRRAVFLATYDKAPTDG